jgi:hypothetical protein
MTTLPAGFALRAPQSAWRFTSVVSFAAFLCFVPLAQVARAETVVIPARTVVEPAQRVWVPERVVTVPEERILVPESRRWVDTQTIWVEEITRWVEPWTSWVEEQTRWIDDQVVWVEARTIWVDEQTVWVPEQEVWNELTQQYEVAPGYEMVIPAHEETIPAHEEFIAGHEITIPAQEELVPGYEETIPAHEETISGYEEVVPAYEIVTPERTETIPGYWEQVPERVVVIPEHEEEAEWTPFSREIAVCFPSDDVFSPRPADIPAGQSFPQKGSIPIAAYARGEVNQVGGVRNLETFYTYREETRINVGTGTNVWTDFTEEISRTTLVDWTPTASSKPAGEPFTQTRKVNVARKTGQRNSADPLLERNVAIATTAESETNPFAVGTGTAGGGSGGDGGIGGDPGGGAGGTGGGAAGGSAGADLGSRFGPGLGSVTAGSIWRDVNGDGILDAVILSGTSKFVCYVKSWNIDTAALTAVFGAFAPTVEPADLWWQAPLFSDATHEPVHTWTFNWTHSATYFTYAENQYEIDAKVRFAFTAEAGEDYAIYGVDATGGWRILSDSEYSADGTQAVDFDGAALSGAAAVARRGLFNFPIAGQHVLDVHGMRPYYLHGHSFVLANLSRPVVALEPKDESGMYGIGQFALVGRYNETPNRRLADIAVWGERIGTAVGIFVEPVDWIMTVIEIYRDPTNPASYIGIIPGIPAGAGVIIKKTGKVLSPLVKVLPGGIKLERGTKDWGLEHILRGHHPLTTLPNKSKFLSGIDEKKLAELLEEALNKPGVWREEGAKRVFEVDMGRVIGTNQGGQPASVLRIVVQAATNSVTTAHPL